MAPGSNSARFTSLAQRVADAYARSLSSSATESGAPPGAADLHGFFASWYAAMADSPEAFGLSVTEDDFLDPGEASKSEHRQQLARKVKKLQETIWHGLSFLYLVGCKGRPEGQVLVLSGSDYAEFMTKHPKIKRHMLRGMALAGLEIVDVGGEMAIRNVRYPLMMPALSRLAEGCSQQPKEQSALLHLSRCDFRAQIQNYSPDPVELYRVFAPADYGRLMKLHEHLLGMGYRTIFQHNAVPVHGWEVQYQGNRKVKSSPFLHVEYSVRLKDRLHLRLKCASSNRIVPLVERQGQALQEDFFHRTNKCGREAGCTWCESRKSLGPYVFTYGGNPHVICWYTNPDMPLRDDAAVELIKEYAAMHEQLGQG